jgi:hypothetical protein
MRVEYLLASKRFSNTIENECCYDPFITLVAYDIAVISRIRLSIRVPAGQI